MQRYSVVLFAGIGRTGSRFTETITILGHPTIQGPPEKHAAWQIEDRSEPPEPTEPKAKIANRIGPPMLSALCVNETHLFLESISR